ncbi:cationic amino acid transporter 3 [Contarinia nasturtii]|uniref:cationic amino acid transporter 3 n=1 Tax=Contarinia nasturtii TaxID=265458 RepID=UPI0012D3843A|nr:cationic amino acid transporter 3 [Contarinia nasturtii]XP_031621345.1 cationic amino acid transporter 3 [Contarinia nasturtii]XP_031621354.1 cationic amino acid transporter 3 [Contarinia nasturtii]XP_031621363.1 cationic amino acid transporter 3 [Contarinia nasturtii]
MMNGCWQAVKRRKQISDNDDGDTQLARVLNLFDLTALGVGSTLGLGVYVLAGSVAYNEAGPAVTISFLIAAIASGIAAICYAEFASRVPKAGSAYVYTYVSVGEFLAFTIGWNLILEYIIGTSSVARGLSVYLDALIDNQMSKLFRDLIPMNVGFLASYPDFFSFIVVLMLAILLSVGVKESSILNNIFTTINLATVVLVIASGAMKSDPANWSIRKEDIPDGVRGGEGGFMPYGIAGVMAGAAKCFYGFVGFDCLATTGEEAQNPKRNIPLSIVLSLIIIFLSYFGVSTVLTMMWPYYLQNPDAPFPHVYEQIGWIEIKWIVSVGAVFALCTSLLGAMFPLPRVLYAMSSDGLLYSVFKRVNVRTKTPLNATLISGCVAAVMALIFDLHQLIDMMSIGTLMAYTIVAVCILVLRYQEDNTSYINKTPSTLSQILRQVFNLNFLKRPNSLSSNITKMTVVLFSLSTAIFCLLIDANWELFSPIHICLMVVGATMILFFIVILRQPKFDCDLSFKVPAVPFLPMLSIFMNLYLMFQLDINTWIRFAVWITIGYIIYFTYGIRQSIEGSREKLELSEHGQNGKHAFEGKCYGRPVAAHTMQSIDDLNNANIDFTTGSTVQLSHQ